MLNRDKKVKLRSEIFSDGGGGGEIPKNTLVHNNIYLLVGSLPPGV